MRIKNSVMKFRVPAPPRRAHIAYSSLGCKDGSIAGSVSYAPCKESSTAAHLFSCSLAIIGSDMTSLNNFGSSALCKQWSKKKCLVTLVFVTVVLVVLCGNYKKIYLSTGNGSKVNGNVLLNSSRSLQGDAKSNNISHLEKYGTDFLYTSTPYQASTEFSPFKGKAIHIETSYEVNEKVVITHREKQVSSQVVCAQNQKFLVYVYSSLHDCDGAISELTGSLVKDLQLGDSWTNDPASACIFVVVVGLWRDTISSGDVSTMIHSLPYWKEYSHKHVLVELSHSSSNSKLLQQIDTNSALVATSYFTLKNTTTTLIPPVMSSQMPRIVIPPTDSLIRKRIKFTLYFEGELEGQKNVLLTNSQLSDICRNCPKTSCSFKCSASRERGALEREWSLCNTATDRLVKCQKALFALVPCGMEGEVGPVTFTRLIEALQCGAIPIVVGDCVNRLPFSEVIEWEKAAMFVQPQELSLTFIFQSEKYARHYMEHGLFLYNTYFSSGLKIVESLIAIIRNHSNHPPMRYHDYIPEVLLNTMPRNSTTAPPNRTQYPQLVWNSPPGPFYIQSYMEYSIAGYLQPTTKLSTEKFTVVILTYHREKGLLHVVGSLKNCPLLDKVVVVWNNEQRYKHPKHFKWPNIGVPIEVNDSYII